MLITPAIALLAFAPSLPATYVAPETPPETQYTPRSEEFGSESDLRAYTLAMAEKYGVSYHEMSTTILGESGWNPNAANPTDSDGGSWGIAQINIGRDAHPDITKEEALNPYFAIDFMAREFSKGNAWKWTCWRAHFADLDPSYCPLPDS